ncbi:mitochondrial glycine transporter B-like isoform X2 [Ornithodoros turicata]|uniref:mitochondrial glycine transporter B-like isoform X2 n=1 Tax=Ornithodoros turicata TaxID=34597 RepID=UPI00313A2D7A
MSLPDCSGSGRRTSQHLTAMGDVIAASPLLKSFLAGSLSGTCSTLLFQPLDLLKTRLQQPLDHGNTRKFGMVAHFFHVIKTEHVLGLWKGTVPSIARCVPGVGLYFCTMHFLKTNLHLDSPSSSEALFLGISSRSIAGIALLPVTVIKTRFESQVYNYQTMSQATRDIYRKDGIRGLYSGLIPTLFRDAPFSGIYLVFYTRAKHFVPQEWKEGSHSMAVNFGCGVLSGVLASLLTQPADVIKTQMQLRPDKFGTVSMAVLFISRDYGVIGFFQGLVPRMLRRTLVTAMAWSFYERTVVSS